MKTEGVAQMHPHEPYDHERPLDKGDTISVFGKRLRIVGMIGLGMPLREITLNVEEA